MAGAGAGTFIFGASNPAAAAKVDETCSTSSRGDFGKIPVTDSGSFVVMDNQWSMPNVQQCVWLNEDGSFGWDFGGNGSGGPNYPEVYIGTRPWGEDTGVADFPIQRGQIDEFTMEVDVDMNIGGGEWDFAEEWWLTTTQPGGSSVESQTTHEVMLLFDWNGQHQNAHSPFAARNVWTDQFGNTIDHWMEDGSGGVSGASFHIFAIQGAPRNTKVDLMEIVDYMDQYHDTSDSHWLTGIELGNEYWQGCSGDCTFNKLSVTINGTEYTAGSDGGGPTRPEPDTTPPSQPGWVSESSSTENSVTVQWDSSSDSGGSGLAEYEVSVDGGVRDTVSAGTTQTQITGLSSGQSYEVSVVAIDGEGNRSSPATTTATTDEGNDPIGEPPTWPDGTQPEDIDGDDVYEDLNGNDRLDTDDVVVYFENYDEPHMADNAEFYDLNGNSRTDSDDVVQLFEQV